MISFKDNWPLQNKHYIVGFINIYRYKIHDTITQRKEGKWKYTIGRFFFFNIYLFIHLFLAASGLSCGTWAPHCSTKTSSCGMLAPEHVGSVVVARGLQSVWVLQLQHMGSLVVACRLRSPTACGILVPRPGIKPASPTLESGFLTIGRLGKALEGS